MLTVGGRKLEAEHQKRFPTVFLPLRALDILL